MDLKSKSVINRATAFFAPADVYDFMTALGDDGYRSPNVVNPTPDPSHPGKYVHQGLQRGSEVYNRGLQRGSESYNIPLRSRVPTVKKK